MGAVTAARTRSRPGCGATAGLPGYQQLTVCRIHYLHLVVIESALYLYNKLLG